MNSKLKIVLIVGFAVLILYLVYKFVIEKKDENESNETETEKKPSKKFIAEADVQPTLSIPNPINPPPNGYVFIGEGESDEGVAIYRYKSVNPLKKPLLVIRPKFNT